MPEDNTKDLIAKVAEMKRELVARENDRKEYLAEATALEEKVGQLRRKASDERKAIELLREAINSTGVTIQVETDRDAANKARALAEQELADVKAMKAQLEASIKKSEEATAKANAAAKANKEE